MPTKKSKISEIPWVGYFDDFGIVAPRPLNKFAVKSFASFNDDLFVMLEKLRSGSGPTLQSLGLTICFRYECEEVIASVSLSKEQIKGAPGLSGRNRPGVKRTFMRSPRG